MSRPFIHTVLASMKAGYDLRIPVISPCDAGRSSSRQIVGASPGIGLWQPVHLTAAETEQLGRLRDTQPALANILGDFKIM